ncbi:MAG: ribonuclease HII [Candidatus Pacearchaeota archaeon]
MAKELIIGIDDAGRGPLIGPMILAGVLLTKEQEKALKEAGVKDSKMLAHSSRVKLAKTIKENCLDSKIIRAFPNEIDSAVFSKVNLNTLEAKKTAEVINALNQSKFQKEKIKVVVDCPSVNIKAWKATLSKFVKHMDNLEINCEHKADVNWPAVSSASILAKVAREDEVEKLKKEYGDFGSGYPADPITKSFLLKYGKKLENSGIFRKSWQTWKSIFPGKSQSSLLDFKK